jgi:hypothetical protein
MEGLDVENWELAHSNIISWASDLSSARSSKDIRALRDRIYDLGKRIDEITCPPVQEESDSPEEDAHPEPQSNEEAVDEHLEAMPEFVENETTVSLLRSFLLS